MYNMFDCCKNCFFRYIMFIIPSIIPSIKEVNNNKSRNNLTHIVLHSGSDTDSD